MPEGIPQLTPNQIRNTELETKYPHIGEIQEEYGDALINTPAGQRGNFFSIDPGGMLGSREAVIKSLADSYEPGKGFAIGFNATAHGVTQQDVANYVLNQYQSQRSKTEAAKYGQTQFPEGQKPNAATNQTELQATVSKVKAGKKLETNIRGIKGGAQLLTDLTQQLGRKPTNTELETLSAEVVFQEPDAVAAREFAAAQLEGQKQTTKASKDRMRIEGGQLNLNKRIAHNTQVINSRNADIATINARNNRIQLENTQRSNQADRDLRRDMALLTRDDNRADRAYNRERDERKDRQMMILQLMKGLSGIGQNLAI